MNDRLRALPSIDALLVHPGAVDLVAEYGRPVSLEALRCVLDGFRRQIILSTGPASDPTPDAEVILEQAALQAAVWLKPSLIPVINASGVILHTNLGRAPLSQAAIRAIEQAGSGYSNLEFDLERGSRGSRLVHAETLLKRLTGAEAALVVNNNAAALLLTLSSLAKHKRVVISRTQLVEIGGGFRVPEVMQQSGARLVEIGTTNRVHLRDYEEALQEPAALILRAHQSNFRIIGFTSEPGLAELAQAAHTHGARLVDDLGSGALLDTARYGMAHEPTVQESLASGADLVCFSGDKLLGGPQAGILIGKQDIIARLRKHPLARAVRADKLCLAGLSATLLHYIKNEAESQIPIWKMISARPDDLRMRAISWQENLKAGEVIQGMSTVGGGSLPGERLPGHMLAIDVRQPNRFLAQLREQNPPIIGRVEHDRVILDPRTVLVEEEGAFLAGVRAVLSLNPPKKILRGNHEK